MNRKKRQADNLFLFFSFPFFPCKHFLSAVPLKSQAYSVSDWEHGAVKCSFEPQISQRVSQGWGARHLQISVVSTEALFSLRPWELQRDKNSSRTKSPPTFIPPSHLGYLTSTLGTGCVGVTSFWGNNWAYTCFLRSVLLFVMCT